MIPFTDLKAQYYTIKSEIHRAIHNVLESSPFILGDEVITFEKDFAENYGANEGIAVNSGTSAYT